MKILIVSYHFHPEENPRSFRWTSISDHWIKQGHSVDVVCKSLNNTNLTESFNGVRLFRVREFLNSYKNEEKKINKNKIKKCSTKNYVISVLRYIWRKIYWPDFACLWIINAVIITRKLIKKSEYNLVITSSIPFSCHLIGYLSLNKSYKKKWIVDIGDPFAINKINNINNNYIYNRLNKYVEYKIIKSTKLITVTNCKIQDLYSKMYKQESHKFIVIPPLLSLQELKLNIDNTNSKKISLEIVFIGTLYKKARNPKILLNWFSSVLKDKDYENLNLNFYGDVNDCHEEFKKYENYINKRIFLHGKVSRKKVPQILNEAKILINIGNESEYQLPSKLIEYMFAAKPLVNFCSSVNDSSVNFLADYDNTINVINEDFKKPEIYESIKNFVNKRHVFNIEKRVHLLNRYSLINIANCYLNSRVEKQHFE